jgi:antitoxin HicB
MTSPTAPLRWPVRLESAEEGGFIVTFPDFGDGVTQGDDREEALAQAEDLLETMVANYLAEGWDLPEPSPARGRPLVLLAPLVAARPDRSGISRARPQIGRER